MTCRTFRSGIRYVCEGCRKVEPIPMRKVRPRGCANSFHHFDLDHRMELRAQRWVLGRNQRRLLSCLLSQCRLLDRDWARCVRRRTVRCHRELAPPKFPCAGGEFPGRRSRVWLSVNLQERLGGETSLYERKRVRMWGEL